jgi:hypothetical protein
MVKLQMIENRLGAAKLKLTKCRRNVIIQENKIRTLQNSLEAKKEEIQLTKIQSDRLELELRTREDAISKSRAQLNLAKTNKEYAAILTQLNTTKADNSKLETQILDFMKDIEADEAEVNELNIQIDAEKQKLETIRKKSEANGVKFEADIKQIQEEWDDAAAGIPAEPLEIFKRVAETYDGEALAFVEKDDPKQQTYTCCGCFMGVTAETVNLLMTKDEVIRCPNCTRILVLGQNES